MTNACPKCKTDNPEDSKFCKECAAPLLQVEDVGPTKTIDTPTEQLTRGSTFAGRYEIIEELGKGGMGKVYRVEDTKIKQEIALKLIKPEIASDKKTIERFKNELKTARNIRHKNVCGMFDLGEEQGTHYIAMEYVSGGDLKRLIRRTKRLDTGTAISIAKQVCQGLAEAHSLGIVHRDLKPSNIMIDDDGVARIMDFGIARPVKGKGITGSGVMIGTPEYMSPEQVEAKEVDQRSDIYSLGIILYEMLTGRLPFEADTPFAVGVMQKSEIPKDPKEFNPQIPDDLSRLILKCLEKEKENRYQNTGEVCAALTRIDEGIPTSERKAPKTKTQTSKEITVTFQRRWAVVAVPVVIVIAAVLAFLIFKKEKVQPPSETPSLVVLPFDNKISPEEENYVDGISGEIRNRLSFIGGLELISIDTAIQYKKSGKTARQIGEEDNIDYVLKGEVHGEKQEGRLISVRILPYLIRTADDTQLPLKSFERNIEGFSEVWPEIAEEVASQLDIVIRDPEIKALQAKLTDNADALNAYLSGLGHMDVRYEEESLELAIQMFELATNLDPDFAHAYGNLSRCHALMHQHGFDQTEERRSLAKQAADEMRKLGPNLPETHLALGSYYYWCLRDYDRALKHLNIARDALPRESETLNMIAYILRRQGDFKGAIQLLNRSMDLDPQKWMIPLEIGITEMALRNYEQAENFFNRAISLDPSNTGGYLLKALNIWLESGDIAKVAEVIEAMPMKNDSAIDLTQYLLKMGDEDFQGALDVLNESSFDVFLAPGGSFILKESLEGGTYAAMGRMDEARDSFEQARLELETLINERPDDPRFHASLGLVYAALARKDDALREVRQAMDLHPVSMDALDGPIYVADYAEVLVTVGEYDEALDQIDYLLSIPAGREISVATLKNGPTWQPLHDHPRFQEIIKKYSK